MALNSKLIDARRLAHDWAADRGILELAPQRVELACDAARFEEVMRHDRVALHLEDVSEIPFVSVIPGVERYQHRARVRAYTGDTFATVTPLSDGYEDYCRDVLKLGAPSIVMAEPLQNATAVALACQHGAAWEALAGWAKDSGRVAIHPYMAIEPVWELAERLAAEKDVDVTVVGPTPGALWVANDKGALDELIRLVLGDEWVMRTRATRDVGRLAGLLREFAGYSTLVGLKRTRCASAMGNAVLRSDTVLAANDDELRAMAEEFLERTEWAGDEDILVVEWADTDISPSTQMWIPPRGHGDPICEGVYDQLLEGTEKVFLGSRPSTLPEAAHADLRHASMVLSASFQEIGYVGRCSFDFIVVGDPNGEFSVRFTECNGRWGGTSTPMFLVDRLGWRDNNGRRPYHAQDFVHSDLIGVPFSDVLARLGDDAFDPESRTGRFVLYNVGPLAKDGKFDVISLGATHEEAVDGIERVLPQRLGI